MPTLLSKKKVEDARLQVHGTIEAVAYSIPYKLKNRLIASLQDYDKVIARTLTSFIQTLYNQGEDLQKSSS